MNAFNFESTVSYLEIKKSVDFITYFATVKHSGIYNKLPKSMNLTLRQICNELVKKKKKKICPRKQNYFVLQIVNEVISDSFLPEPL